MKQNNHSVQNMVDHLLLIFVILAFVSGKILDGIAESQSLSGYYFWLCAHIVIASIFTLLSLVHFKQHWGWFRTLPHNLIARKKDSLFLLLALMVLVVSGFFVAYSKTHVSGFTHGLFGFLCPIVSVYHFYVRHIKGKRR